MKSMGLHTGADLKSLTEKELVRHFGKPGRFFFQIVRGIDNREVQPDRETKSVSAEDTFSQDLSTLYELNPELDKIATLVADRLQRQSLKGKTLTLKIKYSDFKQITRSKSFPVGLDDYQTLAANAKQLLATTDLIGKKIRLLGISISNFREPPPSKKWIEPSDQLGLF